MDYILASASPRREELFKLISNEFEVIPADIEEVIPEGIRIEDAAEYLACQKALWVCEKLKDSGRYEKSTMNTIVVGCDTIVLIDGHVLGKPKDSYSAEEMLKMLSGNRHSVITGCCVYLYNDSFNKKIEFSQRTEVEFYALSDEEIRQYILTKEPADKAGAYGIQEKGALLVKKIEGDYFNVVGLPVARLSREINKIIGEAL